ncbi:MAG: DNA primase, partial [Lachnospiraceae bacterium]|nr:DNA primase [Lachnospiraceae bacterium]
NGLYEYLRGKGYSDQAMRDAGLIDITEKKGATDVFWNRVMVPIADAGGKVIAFGGRVLGDGMPKYINTKDTLIFNKRQNLFALYYARKSKRRGLIICEGYMDVISMHQAGFDNAVASLGTAFTINQANLIKRYTDEVYLAYDSDGAGVNASLKNIAILRQVGISARVIDMKPYKDPDEFIQALGSEAYEERINKAITGVEFEVRTLSGRYNMNIPEEKAKFANAVAKILAELEDPVTRMGYVDMISNQYDIDKNGLKGKVSQYGDLAIREAKANVESELSDTVSPGINNKKHDDYRPQKLLLTCMVNDISLFEKLDGIISEADFIDEDIKLVAGKLYEQYRSTGQVQPAMIVNMFDDVEKQQLIGNILQTELPYDVSPEEKEKVINEVVRKVKKARIDYELDKYGDDVNRVEELIQAQSTLGKLYISII